MEKVNILWRMWIMYLDDIYMNFTTTRGIDAKRSNLEHKTSISKSSSDNHNGVSAVVTRHVLSRTSRDSKMSIQTYSRGLSYSALVTKSMPMLRRAICLPTRTLPGLRGIADNS